MSSLLRNLYNLLTAAEPQETRFSRSRESVAEARRKFVEELDTLPELEEAPTSDARVARPVEPFPAGYEVVRDGGNYRIVRS